MFTGIQISKGTPNFSHFEKCVDLFQKIKFPYPQVKKVKSWMFGISVCPFHHRRLKTTS